MMNTFPSDYKVTSIEIGTKDDQVRFKRNTYGVITWLSDVGGLWGTVQAVFLVTTFLFVTYDTKSLIVS